jgi:predicted CoA-binding protein
VPEAEVFLTNYFPQRSRFFTCCLVPAGIPFLSKAGYIVDPDIGHNYCQYSQCKYVPMKTTLVLGASDNPSRYSNMAVKKLRNNNHSVVAVGKRAGTIADVPISTETTKVDHLDTISLYLNPGNQKEYYKYIIDSKPKRIIFNPGTENEELAELARKNGIVPIEACTLVLLSTGQF